MRAVDPSASVSSDPPVTDVVARTFDVAIIGAGYVGLPLAQVFADAGRAVVLVDVSDERVAQILRGESYIEDVPSERLQALSIRGRSTRPPITTR